jgi:hypothetical protein
MTLSILPVHKPAHRADQHDEGEHRDQNPNEGCHVLQAFLALNLFVWLALLRFGGVL